MTVYIPTFVILLLAFMITYYSYSHSIIMKRLKIDVKKSSICIRLKYMTDIFYFYFYIFLGCFFVLDGLSYNINDDMLYGLYSIVTISVSLVFLHYQWYVIDQWKYSISKLSKG